MANSSSTLTFTAITGSAVNAINRLSTAMGAVQTNVDNVAKKMYNASHTIQEFGQNIYSVGQRATIGISAPLAGIAKTMVETGSSMKAMHNTFKISFGDMAGEAQSWSRELSKSVGLSSGIIDETSLNFRKMGGAFGLTGQDALDFSKKWTQLTLDVSAFNDIPISEATERMMSGLRGEADAVEKLGIFMGEANLKAEMLNMGLKGQYSDLSMAQKQAVLYSLAMKQTAQANGQASREAVSFQNSMANLKQKFKEISEQFYIAVEPMVLDYMKQLSALMDKLKELTPEQIKTIAEIVKWAIIIPPIIMYLGAFVEGLGRLGKVFSFLLKMNPVAIFLGIKSALETVYIYALYVADGLAVVGGWITTAFGAVVTVLEGIATAVGLSVGWIIAIIVGIAIAVYLIIKYWDEIKAWTIQAWGTIVTFLTNVWNSIATTAVAVWTSITTFLAGVWAGIVSLFNQYVMPIVNTAISIFNSVLAVVVAFGQGVWSVLSAIGGFFKYVWMDLIAPILQYVGGFFVAVGQLIVWCIQQLIGMAISWLANQWSWLYNSVIVPIGTAIGNFFIMVGNWFVQMYQTYIVPAIAGIKSAWNGLCNAFVAGYNAYIVPMINWFKSAWASVQAWFSSAVASIKAVWQSFCSGIASLWNSYGMPLINGIKSAVSSVVSAWSSAWASAKSVFQGFANGVMSVWNAVKSAFKLPHISISGSWDLTPPSISFPKFGISWYKNGGYFDSASVIGVGEAGAEAVVPLTNSKSMGMIGKAVADYMPDYARGSADGSAGTGETVITGNTFVVREEADIEKVAQELYRLEQRERRGKGRNRDV